MPSPRGPIILLAFLLAPAAAARGQGFHVALSSGVARSLAEVAPSPPGAGAVLEVQPGWRFRSGLSLGVGVRYTAYAGVPDRGALYVEGRYTGPRGAVRPVIGLRAGGFTGGDEGGDDPYIGVEVGPIAGVEVPVGQGVALQALGSVYGVAALFRGLRALPGFQVGVVIR